MFVSPNRLFIDSFPDEAIVFLTRGTGVAWQRFRADIAAYGAFVAKTVTADTVVLSIGNDMYRFAVCFFGLLHAGKAVVLPAQLREGTFATLASIATDIVTDEAKNVPDGFSVFPVVPPADCASTDFAFRDLANAQITFFTSGSTSTPKRIDKRFDTLSAEVETLYVAQQHVAHGQTVWIGSVDVHHIYGMLWRLLLPLCSGSPTETERILSPEMLEVQLRAHVAVAFVTTPSFLDHVLAYREQYEFAKTCVAVFSSGSLLRGELSAGAYDVFGVSPYEIFGSTETGGVAWRQQCAGERWTVFPAVRVTAGADGCLIVDSPFTATNPYVMSDAVTLASDTRSFLLHGRVDRLVKINEKRVSLPQVESVYEAHPFVKRCVVVPFDAAGALRLAGIFVLRPAGVAALKAEGKRAVVAEITRTVLPHFDRSVIPRKIRIVHDFPVNAQGKLLKEKLLPLVQSPLSEPVVECATWTADAYTADLTFLADAIYFQGHFPDNKILPGVVQLHFAVFFAERYFGMEGQPTLVKKIKFSHVIQPGDRVQFSLTRTAPQVFMYHYALATGELCASGILHYA